MHRVSVPFLTALLLLFVPVFGRAQLPTPAGPILPAEGHPAARYLDPDTFVAPGGDFVRLMWESLADPDVFPPFHLVGQRFSADGTPKAAAFEVDSQPGTPAFAEGFGIGYQAGVFLTDGTFAIVWATYYDCCGEPDLYLRFFDGEGTPRSGPQRISSADVIETLAVERLDDDSVVVLATYDALFQVLNAEVGVFSIGGVGDSGMRRAGKDVPDSYECAGLFGEIGLGVGGLPNGDFLVAFSRIGSDGPQPSCQELPSGIFLRQFSPSGDARGPEVRIASAEPRFSHKVVKLVPEVGLLLLEVDFSGTEVTGEWFSIEGERLAPAFVVGSGFSGLQWDGVIATPPGGDILASWNRASEVGQGEVERLVRALEVPCTPSPTTLCLEGGRFRAEVDWADFRDREGSGSGQPLSDETGYFTFFNPENVELVVKVLDGSANNGNFWVFYGALSNVEYRLTVTDTENTLQKVYRNPPRTFASVGDTGAFPAPLQAPPTQSKLSPAELASLLPTLATDGPGLATAGESGTDLSFQGGRFRASVEWRDFQDRTGFGHGATLTDDTGYFWFFRPENVELVVKVLDGSANNGNYWVFYGALSNVEYTLAVEDTETGTTKTYFNPLRTFASDGDTMAFPE